MPLKLLKWCEADYPHSNQTHKQGVKHAPSKNPPQNAYFFWGSSLVVFGLRSVPPKIVGAAEHGERSGARAGEFMVVSDVDPEIQKTGVSFNISCFKQNLMFSFLQIWNSKYSFRHADIPLQLFPPSGNKSKLQKRTHGRCWIFFEEKKHDHMVFVLNMEEKNTSPSQLPSFSASLSGSCE